MRSTFLALAAVAASIAPLAQASSVYSASFQLTEPTLPRLLTGTGIDGPDSVAGQWTSINRVDAVVDTLAQPGGLASHSDNLHRVSGPPLSFGETSARVTAAQSPATGTATVYGTQMQASLQQPNAQSSGSARATWNRDFSLDAHSSFTFSGLAAVSIGGDASPLNAQTFFNLDNALSFASLSLADTANRVSTSISATLTGAFSSSLSDIFAYSIGPNGLLSLTITNNSASALTGRLAAGTAVNVAAPVPEPAAVLSMLLGLGLVGAVARRRAASNDTQAEPTAA